MIKKLKQIHAKMSVFHHLLLLILVFVSLYHMYSVNAAPTTNQTLLNLPINTAKSLGKYTSNQLLECPAHYGTITDFGRFTYDSNNHQMLLWGGGHAATLRDDVDVFNLNTLNWGSAYNTTPMSEMTPTNYDKVTGGWKTSGHPISRHIYDMLTFAPNTGELLMMAGTQAGSNCVASWWPEFDNNSNYYPGKIWHYNPVSKIWRVSKSAIALGHDEWLRYGASSEYDPISGKVIVMDTYGLWVYDPVTETQVKVIDNPRLDITNASNLIYYPPNQKMYYIMKTGSVAELTLNRSDFTKSTINVLADVVGAKFGSTPANGDNDEVGWAYDSVNKIIGGGVRDSKFYVFDPRVKAWAVKNMIIDAPSGVVSGTVAAHSLDYDPINNVFIYITGRSDTGSGWEKYTWTYKYGNGNEITPVSSAPVNALCGNSIYNKNVIPLFDLCAIGNVSYVDGGPPWVWSCTGYNGGALANCRTETQAPSTTPTTTPPHTNTNSHPHTSQRYLWLITFKYCS